MKIPVEIRCIVCLRIFCCAECRWKHEKATHGLQYDCPICREQSYLCRPEELNQPFLEHLAKEHLPLQCRKCNKMFAQMEELSTINECNSISELIDKESDSNSKIQIVDEKFNSILEKTSASAEEFEAIVSVDKTSKTAVITPIIRMNSGLVDYESSGDEEDRKPEVLKTPHAKLYPKTPNAKKYTVTPHVKKFLLLRQKNIEEHDETSCEVESSDVINDAKTTPQRNENDTEKEKEMTTPTSHLPHIIKLTQIVTTSTPTNPAVGGWSMFSDQGADSPLSEIENGCSPAQCTVEEASKGESSNVPAKLKSIIISGSRIRLGSQDSSEKQVTFQDSENSVKTKRVKFADDTVFEPEPKVKRVYRKPKRMLTPGPQRPKYCCNPRFQALINRFEHQGITMARTPINPNRDPPDSTPDIGEHANMPARAINFKEDSPIVEPENYSKDSNELFKTCVDSPVETRGINNAITALTANIAGSLQNCLASALKTTEQETEIQFKFVITKKTVSVKKISGETDANTKSTEIERVTEPGKENIWSTVAKVVKTVFWGEGTNLEATTPHRSHNSTGSSSASKRKYDVISDAENSPLNHKRHKYEGRIRGRPPLRRSKTWVSNLRSTLSAEQPLLMQKSFSNNEEILNQSF